MKGFFSVILAAGLWLPELGTAAHTAYVKRPPPLAFCSSGSGALREPCGLLMSWECLGLGPLRRSYVAMDFPQGSHILLCCGIRTNLVQRQACLFMVQVHRPWLAPCTFPA